MTGTLSLGNRPEHRDDFGVALDRVPPGPCGRDIDDLQAAENAAEVLVASRSEEVRHPRRGRPSRQKAPQLAIGHGHRAGAAAVLFGRLGAARLDCEAVDRPGVTRRQLR